MNKNLQLTLAWFMLAFLVTGAAIWQAQVAVAREIAARHQLPPPPAKTRHAERNTARPADTTGTGDPVADYAARRKKGLTDREIGWIVEDFQTAGLDLGIRAAPKEEYLAQRRTQDRWYHDALVEAWSLTPEQSAKVTEKLAELYDQAKADFIEALAVGPQPIQVNGQLFILTSAEPIHRLIDANSRLQDGKGAFLPWNLGGFLVRSSGPPLKNTNTLENGPPPTEIVITEPIQIMPAEPNLVTVDSLLPRTAPPPDEEPVQTAPAEDDILTQLRKLHPAQLKLLLLIAPEKTKVIQLALETVQ